MSSLKYLEKMTNIQQNLLEYLDDEDVADAEDKFKNFRDLLSKIKIQDDQHELKSFLYLLVKISNNHHRTDDFFNKIKQILEYLKDDIKKYFSNSELFHIFKDNKRILLLITEEEIMNFDVSIAKQIIKTKYINYKYPQYFQSEIQPFIQEKWFPKSFEKNWAFEIQKEIPEDFYEKRKIGENDKYICQLIRKDLLDDFIVYVNEKNYKLDSIINQSIYETNNFLLIEENKEIKLIEYAVFFGSIKIFNYLRLKVSLTPSLWYFAIHGNNAEIIQILEENKVELPEDESYKQLFIESIKCHHNEFAYYIQNNYSNNEKCSNNENEENDLDYEMINGLKYYNFSFIQNDKINEISFNYICKYDYYILFIDFLNTKNFDISKATIKNQIFQCN